MRKRPLEQAWRIALTVVALAATAMALYLQVFERRALQEEARLAAVRLDQAMAESRARLRAEILPEPRKDEDEAEPGAQPIPDTVLRRLETGGDAGSALAQSLDVFGPQEALVIAGLGESLDSLARRMEESDLALRRELEELQAATLREADVAFKTTILLLVAVASLIGQLLPSLWRRSGARSLSVES